MKKEIKEIEVEGKEIMLENSNGDKVIIPKDKVAEVMMHFAEIDKIVDSLPVMGEEAGCGGVHKEKAEDGMIVKKDTIDNDEVSSAQPINTIKKEDYTGTETPIYTQEQQLNNTMGQQSDYNADIATITYNPLNSKIKVKQGGMTKKEIEVDPYEWGNERGIDKSNMNVLLLKMMRDNKQLNINTATKKIEP